jgi:hypothetical protein
LASTSGRSPLNSFAFAAETVIWPLPEKHLAKTLSARGDDELGFQAVDLAEDLRVLKPQCKEFLAKLAAIGLFGHDLFPRE